MGWMVRCTNLVIHDRIANVLNQTDKFSRILSIVEESLNLSLFFQWRQIMTSVLQLPTNTRMSGVELAFREYVLAVLVFSFFLAL